jgi:hypothetical protein
MGALGFLTKNRAGMLVRKNLRKTRKSGGNPFKPMRIATKLNPQINTTSKARKKYLMLI